MPHVRAIVAAVLFASVASGVGLGVPDTAIADVVNCYDAARGLVQEKRTGNCDGKAVSDARARAIRDSRQRERIRKLKEPAPGAKGSGRGGTQIGSGFAVSGDGHIVTARHVVDGCERVRLETASGEVASARVLSRASGADIALLRSTTDLPSIPLPRQPRGVEAGEIVSAIGYPERGLPTIRPSRTSGEVVDVGTLRDGRRIVAFRGAIRQGNSGGPLVTAGGNLAGIVVAKVNTPAVFKATGKVVRDIAIAHPVALLRDLIDTLDIDPTDAFGGPTALDTARARTLRVICRPRP